MQMCQERPMHMLALPMPRKTGPAKAMPTPSECCVGTTVADATADPDAISEPAIIVASKLLMAREAPIATAWTSLSETSSLEFATWRKGPALLERHEPHVGCYPCAEPGTKQKFKMSASSSLVRLKPDAHKVAHILSLSISASRAKSRGRARKYNDNAPENQTLCCHGKVSHA